MSSYWRRPAQTLLFLSLIPRIIADPAVVKFSDCFSGDAAQKLNIDTVYAQVLKNGTVGSYLNLTLLGNSPQEIDGSSNTSSSLTTLFTTTNVLTLTAWDHNSYFCQTLRPPSPLPSSLGSDNDTYCPIPAGPFALSSSIPWGDHRALTTLTTRLKAVDPSRNEILCVDIETTPLKPQSDNPYGRAKIIFWFTVGLAIAYWVIVGLARIVSAWGRGISRHAGIWSRAQSAGYILASAISGERLASQPALLRFCTPSLRDIIFHTQWCAVLAMVAVEWPSFAYPILAQTAWSTLSFNITVLPSASDHHWNPLYTPTFSPPSNFADQLNDAQSPLYIDQSQPNTLYTLPDDATHGISSFAYTVGVRPQDLFPICLIVFLAIIATAIVVAFGIWLIDYVACLIVKAFKGDSSLGPGSIGRLGARSPAFTNIKEPNDTMASATAEESKSLNGLGTSGASIFRPSSRFGLPLSGSGNERAMHRRWWRIRSELGSFHGSVLHGNLVRILLLFHLPVTVFSAYHMTLPTSMVSMTSKALAGLSFAIFSIIIPAHLAIRVTFTTTNKLYDETRTLLSLGPLYNHYRHGSQLFAALFFASNLIFGVTIGAGQASGTAQAIIILVVEVVSALVTSIWLPWGSGASMGLISFLFCVARIVVAVLVVILSPAISIDDGAGGWVAYGILIILALVYLALFLMIVVKVIEAFTRIIGCVPFNYSKHVVHSGLLGACGLLGCFGSTRRRKRRRPREDGHSYQATPLPLQPHEYHKSDLPPFMTPIHTPGVHTPVDGTPPRFQGGVESRKGSTHSGAPPSVLRPEHANQPYKEDSEDEGFIMGPWQKQGYSATANNQPATAPPPKPSTGFARVGGGRAHIDSPYAISGGSTHTFPSFGQPSTPQHMFPDEDDSPPPSLSTVGNAYDVGTLPPGAMPAQHHVRTKSQTAVIEDPTLIAALQRISPVPQSMSQTSTPTTPGFVRVPATAPPPPDDDDADSIEVPKKKKPWYHIRRKLHSSDGNPPPPAPPPEEPPTLPVDEEMGGVASTPSPQRSFVVIRKPQSQAGRGGQPGSNSSRSHNATD